MLHLSGGVIMGRCDYFEKECDKSGDCKSCLEGWHVILNTLEGNKIVLSKNNPKQSGQYLCTCILRSRDREYEHRYLRIMEYDADKKHWHDIGNKSAISHVILAWKNQEVCTFSDFDYKAGVLFEKR